MDRRGFLLAAPAIILTPGLLMPVRKMSGAIVEWSIDGLQWTDDVLQFAKDNPAPAYIFHRRWVSREELSLLYPIEVEQLGA